MSDALYLAGDLSGTQRLVLRVKSAGKAQAKRLRARSFLLELVERAALWHVEQRFHVFRRRHPDTWRWWVSGTSGGELPTPRELERLEADVQRMIWDEFGGRDPVRVRLVPYSGQCTY